MNFVPIMLSVSGKRVIVIGGGEAAYKKVRNLMPHCSDIVIISDAFDSRLSEFPVEKLRLHIDDVEQLDSFLIHENIVIIATDDPLLNGKIASVCKARDILFNRVDDDRSPFIFPASFEYKGVAVSVSTLGSSPSLARFLKDKVQEDIEKYVDGLPVIEKLREMTRTWDLHARADFFQSLFRESKFWELVFDKKLGDAYDFGIQLSSRIKR